MDAATWQERLSIRGLEETARTRFQLDSPLIIASYLGPDNERYILSNDDDISRLYDEAEAPRANGTAKVTVELETLEDFLRRENSEDNAGVIKKVVQELHLERHPLDANANEGDFGAGLEGVLTELRRLGLKDRLVGQIRNRIVNFWARNRLVSGLRTEEDSGSALQSKLVTGRRMHGGFADQSSIDSESHEDSSFMSQASRKEEVLAGAGRQVAAPEEEEEGTDLLELDDPRGQRSVDSDILNWHLEPIMPLSLSRQHSHDDSDDVTIDVSAGLSRHHEVSRDAKRALPLPRKGASPTKSKSRALIDDEDTLERASKLVQDISQQAFQKQHMPPQSLNYELEGSMVSEDFDVTKAPSKVARKPPGGKPAEPLKRKASKPIEYVKNTWNNLKSAFGHNDERAVASSAQDSTRNANTSKHAKK